MTFRAFPVAIVHAGRKYSASYRLENSGELYVDSAYGGRQAKAGRDPKAQAQKLLTEIVEARYGPAH